MSDTRFGFLVETAWLQDHLGDPDLRILDCTVFLKPVDGGMRPESGRAQWQEAHIPGAGFADLLGDLSDRESALPIMMPPAGQFAAAMESYGVSDDSRVVLYDAGMNMWAARVWWMLRAFGFERAAVLNGGWKKWTAEGRPVESGQAVSPSHEGSSGQRHSSALGPASERPASEGTARSRNRFTARPQPGLIADWREVLANVGDRSVQLVHALSADEFSGKVTRVARAGHIPGSVNVPAGSLVDPATNAYLDSEELRKAFAPVLSSNPRRIITYCGGGIAASSDALVLTMLGATDVAIYDGSLVEWASRPELPLTTG